MDIVVKGRHAEVPERFRQHATEKLARVSKLDAKIIRIDVEVTEEHNPRQSALCERIELTCRSRGPVIRAEAAADDTYAALDLALGKLEARLRRAAERRRDHHRPGRSAAGSTTAAGTANLPTAAQAVDGAASPADGRFQDSEPVPAGADTDQVAPAGTPPAVGPRDESTGSGDSRRGGLIVREKLHTAEPMTIDQALLEMELVGHDFFLFADKESGRPSVVYRRRGYDYGVIRLDAPQGGDGGLSASGRGE